MFLCQLFVCHFLLCILRAPSSNLNFWIQHCLVIQSNSKEAKFSVNNPRGFKLSHLKELLALICICLYCYALNLYMHLNILGEAFIRIGTRNLRFESHKETVCDVFLFIVVQG